MQARITLRCLESLWGSVWITPVDTAIFTAPTPITKHFHKYNLSVHIYYLDIIIFKNSIEVENLQPPIPMLFNELTLHDKVSAEFYVTRSNMDCNQALLQPCFCTSSLPLFCSSVAGGWPELAPELRYSEV